ncbi:hypothetical protein TNCV_1651571 [Trichonephila clavipes]|nr:hypothetical protein TNCV_1651571 [Trichonephila clavipes]
MGADRVSLIRVYQALILSRLDYGCVVYGSARASALKRLDTVHHSALRRYALVRSELRLLPLKLIVWHFYLAIGLNGLYGPVLPTSTFSERARAAF